MRGDILKKLNWIDEKAGRKMSRLEELVSGSVVTGIYPNEPVTVVSTKWYGTATVEVFYKTHQGMTGTQLLYREDLRMHRLSWNGLMHRLKEMV